MCLFHHWLSKKYSVCTLGFSGWDGFLWHHAQVVMLEFWEDIYCGGLILLFKLWQKCMLLQNLISSSRKLWKEISYRLEKILLHAERQFNVWAFSTISQQLYDVSNEGYILNLWIHTLMAVVNRFGMLCLFCASFNTKVQPGVFRISSDVHLNLYRNKDQWNKQLTALV